MFCSLLTNHIEKIIMMKFKKEKVTRTLIVVKGANHSHIEEIDIRTIWIPKNPTGKPGNITRPDLDEMNVGLLQVSPAHGIDYSEKLPIVRKLNKPMQVKGITYLWELVCGTHRVTVLLKNLEKKVINGIRTDTNTNWLFDVYEFPGGEKSRVDLQTLENNHHPSSKLTALGLADMLGWYVENGYCENNEKEFRKVLAPLTNVHNATIGKAIKMAIRANGTYQDFKTYGMDEVREFLEEKSNYDDDRPLYKCGGVTDTARDEIAWSVYEGMIYEYVMNAARAFVVRKKPSYFHFHTKRPTDKKTLEIKRTGMLSELETIETALEESYKYKEEKGVWPWRVATILPQDNKNGEKTFVDPSSI